MQSNFMQRLSKFLKQNGSFNFSNLSRCSRSTAVNCPGTSKERRRSTCKAAEQTKVGGGGGGVGDGQSGQRHGDGDWTVELATSRIDYHHRTDSEDSRASNACYYFRLHVHRLQHKRPASRINHHHLSVCLSVCLFIALIADAINPCLHNL